MKAHNATNTKEVDPIAMDRINSKYICGLHGGVAFKDAVRPDLETK
jgi:hypothetical protein